MKRYSPVCTAKNGPCQHKKIAEEGQGFQKKKAAPNRRMYSILLALPAAAPRILQLRLPRLDLLALGLADQERAASGIFRLKQFFVCQFLGSPRLGIELLL
jgi:hypothetical protein